MTNDKLDELERLWAEVQKREPGYGFAKIALDKLLADALPELVARVRELEGALKPFAETCGWGSAFEEGTPILLSALPTAWSELRIGLLKSDFTRARAALQTKGPTT
jgi:uncharacterized small protein (DUF1192 family)